MEETETITDEEFVELFNKHKNKIRQICWKFARNAEVADEYLHQVMCLLWEKAVVKGMFEKGTNFSGWACTAAYNHMCSHYRKMKKRTDGNHCEINNLLDGGLEPSYLPTPDDYMRAKDAKRKARDLVAFLPEAQRDVVILFELQEKQYEEIAEQLNIPVGTVMSRLFRGRRKLEQFARKNPEFLD